MLAQRFAQPFYAFVLAQHFAQRHHSPNHFIRRSNVCNSFHAARNQASKVFATTRRNDWRASDGVSICITLTLGTEISITVGRLIGVISIRFRAPRWSRFNFSLNPVRKHLSTYKGSNFSDLFR